MLCGGSASSKIETAFSLFDYNNDSRISQDEMCRYLRSVYSIVYEADPTARSRMGGADPDTLARVTTSDAFERLGKRNADETLSFDEFKRWCEMEDSEKMTSVINDASSKMSLGEVRRLTCLDTMRTQDVFDCFMRRAFEGNNDGTISKECFCETIEELSTMGGSRSLNQNDQDRLRVLISGLYSTFDIDNDGKVSTQELLSGLTILCGGDVEEKCRASFELYDTDHSKSISRDEMESHLASVYLVVYHVESSTADVTGVDAKTLARETTRDAFENAEGLNDDGTMSYETFREWYLSTTTQDKEEEEKKEEEEEKMETTEEEQSTTAKQEWVSLAEIRRVTNLEDYELDDVVNRFLSVCGDDGRMDMSTFYSVMIEFATQSRQNLSAQDEAKLRHVLNHLFVMFDTNNDSTVDAAELLAGLSALVGGERDDKTKIAFMLFDTSGDGFIQFEEMARYLYCVYRVIYAAEPSTRQRVGNLTERELAVKTAQEAFEKADTNNDSKLSFEEFKAWYTGASDFASRMSNNVDDILMMSLEEVRQVLNIPENATVETLIAHFMDCMTDDEYVLSRSNFIDALSKWRKEDCDSTLWTKVVARLYDLMDVNSDQMVQVSEMISGLATILQTDTLGKFRSLFRLFSFENEEISEANMCRFLVSSYRVLLKFDKHSEQRETSPEVLAYKKTKEIFSKALLSERGNITFDEFCRLYAMLTADGLLEKTSKAAESVPIDEIRHLMHLESHSVSDVLSRFQSVTRNGEIIREDFEKILTELAEEGDVEDPDTTRLAILYLFNLFDTDGSGAVDSNELRSGLSILCSGNPDQKAKAAFEMYDTNKDGRLSKNEMISYLKAVYTVVYETKPEDVEQLDVQNCTPSELAEITADECFERLGIQDDEGLTFEQFQNWYNSTHERGDEEEEEETDEEVSSTSTMENLRRVTGLGAFNVRDVMHIFVSSQNETKELTRTAFVKTLRRIIDTAETNSSESEILSALNRLFDIFDTNHDGVVDATELSCGLTVIVGGSAVDKSQVAFNLIDTNHDNSISILELQTYLKSVFNVMLLTGSDLDGHSPEDLANETARECFEFNMVSVDKGISLSQFRRWYAEEDEDENEDSEDVDHREPRRKSSSVIRNFNAYVQQNMSLEEMQKITGLDSFAPETVYVKFLEVSENGCVSRDAFYKVMQELSTFGGKDPDERLRVLLDVIFQLFDADESGSLSLNECSAGLSVLCGGDPVAKAKCSFDVFSGGRGYVTIEMMEQYLTSVYKLVYKANPETQEAVGGLSPEELASKTSAEIFLERDLNSDGQLSFDEFSGWYTGSMNILAISPMPPTPTEPTAREETRQVQLPDLDTVKSITNLGLVTQNEALLLFEDYINEDTKSLNYESFETVMLELIESGDGEDAEEAERILPSLYRVFDVNNDGFCTIEELSHGLSLLTLQEDDSEHDAMIQEIFSRIDRDNNSVITQVEFETYLQSILSVLSGMDAYYRTIAILAGGVVSLSKGVAVALFSKIDLDDKGSLSVGEFLMWFKSTELMDLLPHGADHAPTSIHFRSRLNVWREAFSLGTISASQLMDEFAEVVENGVVSFENFSRILARQQKSNDDDDDDDTATLAIKRSFFKAMGEGQFRALKIACAVLCAGSKTTRSNQLFDSLDRDMDNKLSHSETIDFFNVLFRLVSFAGTTGLLSLGLTSSELARLVSSAILKSDTHLDRKTFNAWFHNELNAMTHSSLQRGSIVEEKKIEDDFEEVKDTIPTKSEPAKEKVKPDGGIELKQIGEKKSNIHVSRQGSIFMSGSNTGKSGGGSPRPKIHVSRTGSIDIQMDSPLVKSTSPPRQKMSQAREDLLKLVWGSIDVEGTNKVTVKQIQDNLQENPKLSKLLSVSIDENESFLKRLNRLTLDSVRPITWTDFKRSMYISEHEFHYFVEHNTIPGIRHLNNFQQYRVKILFENIADFETTMSRETFLTKMKDSALGESQGITFFDIMDSDKNDCVTLAEFAKFFDDIHDGSMDYDEMIEFILDFEAVDKRPAAREV